MGVFNKVKGWLDSDNYDDDEIDNEMEDERGEENSSRGYSSESNGRKNRVVNIHATTQLQVVLVKPERLADVFSVADHLRDKKTVVLNLESTTKDDARRMLDFLNGVAYANQGHIKKVANSTFIITPINVDIMGDMLMDELENNGMYI